MQVKRRVTTAVATVLLLAGCGAGERDATPDERDFVIAVGEVVNIPMRGTNESARTAPEIFEATGDAAGHELRTGRCREEMPGCTQPTRLRVTGVKSGITIIRVRACFYENGVGWTEECDPIGDPVTYTVVVK